MFLVNLGGPSLWDIDEGNNAEAAREMMERGEWVVPTFNFELRTDKPVLLYWLQIGAYRLLGVNPLAARLPSALAALLTMLLVYELGRLMFGAAAGLLAGVVLASVVLFSAAAHFANPDALLNAFTTLIFFLFWRSYAHSGRGWFVPAGVSAGLAMLTKGPVGLLLPGGVVLLFLAWERRLSLLWDRRLALGFLAFFLVAAPWYAMVGADTKGEFLRGFFLNHNLGRYGAAMENHGGPIFYYVLVLLVGLAPWSVFLGPAVWHGLRALRAGPEAEMARPQAAFRFLWCWIGVYFVFFSFSGTKLPNYILPLYPPLALLTARFLDGWRRGVLSTPPWVMKFSLVCLALTGATFSLGLLVAGGVVPLSVLRGRTLPGLETQAMVGLVLVGGAAVAWCYLQRRERFIGIFATTAVVFVATLAAWGGAALNPHKAPEAVARMVAAHRTEREIRIGSYQYFQPSLVFYARRQVSAMDKEADALEFLACPLSAYLLVPAPVWNEMEQRVTTHYRVIGRQRDFYRHCDVVVVANR
jgi:4-amino-4-deoxy-L-arabinose transferase-like glycosyltransferase